MSPAVKTARVSCAASLLLMFVATLPPTASQATEQTAFTIPAEDGYGIGDCMKAGSACGQAVANSWCESHGHLKAVAYGSGDDVTGSVPDTLSHVASGDVVIRCTD